MHNANVGKFTAAVYVLLSDLQSSGCAVMATSSLLDSALTLL